MMFSLGNACAVFGKLDLVFSGYNAFVTFIFLAMFYPNLANVPGHILLKVFLAGGALGLFIGLYFKYRSKLSSLHAVGITVYSVVSMEILFGGSVSGLALIHAGRPDLRWFAFYTNASCMLLTLLIGMLLEAKKLGLLNEGSLWREEIGKYLDFSKRLIDPALTTNQSSMEMRDMAWIGGALAVNIPLFFQIYGGGRDNSIFLAAPLSMATFSYINLKTFGPGLTRISLLRRIESELGFRFQNADYEEIQRIRHDFVLAPRLMKNYQPSVCETNREARIAMKKRHNSQQQQIKEYELKQEKKGKR